MRRIIPTLAIAAWVLSTQPDRAAAGQTRSQPQQVYAIPPPPPMFFDEFPAIYGVAVDNDGNMLDGQDGVIANALGSWAGPRHAAFLLCYRPAVLPIDWTAAMHALDIVARGLRAGGALVVVRGHRPSDEPPSSHHVGRSHVDIETLIRD